MITSVPMKAYTKEDLYYNDYQWGIYPVDSSKISGRLDQTKVNRLDGNEVLYLINKIAQMWDFQRIESYQKMERMIREKVPAHILLQTDIATWIQINWRDCSFEHKKK